MQGADLPRVANMLGGLTVAVADLVAAGSREAALVALDSHPSATVAHLSGALGRSHSATVRLVDGLARDGLVERRSGRDGRSIALVLSPRGSRAAGEVRAQRALVLDSLVATLDADDVGRLSEILERLLEATATDAGSRWRICRLCEESRCEDGRECPVDRAAPR